MYHLIIDKSNITCSLICIDRKMEKSSVVEIGRIKNSRNFLELMHGYDPITLKKNLTVLFKSYYTHNILFII